MAYHCQVQYTPNLIFIGGGLSTDDERKTSAFLWDLIADEFTPLPDIPFETFRLS